MCGPVAWAAATPAAAMPFAKTCRRQTAWPARGHLRHRPGLELDATALTVCNKVHAAQRRILLQVVEPPVRPAALAALDGGPHDRLGDCQHEPKIARRVPAGVVLARSRNV